jgi:hypothetical protein
MRHVCSHSLLNHLDAALDHGNVATSARDVDFDAVQVEGGFKFSDCCWLVDEV